jgi:hypothetical protein
VERTAADDVALAVLPSTSGAHWANRDNAVTTRPTGGRSAPFRRPPALNSFPEDDPDSLSPSAYLPDDTAEVPGTSWFAGTDTDPGGTWPPDPGPRNGRLSAPEPPAPEFGPAPPSSPGRISFGVTAGPISPAHHQSAAAPTSPAGEAAGRLARSAPGNPGHLAQLAADDAGRPTLAAAGDPSHHGHQARPARDGRPNRWEAQRQAQREAQAEDTGIGQITGPGREIRPHRASRREARDHSRDTGAQKQLPAREQAPRRDQAAGRDQAAAHGQTAAHGPAAAREQTAGRGLPQVPVAAPRRSRALVVATVALAAVVLLGGGIAGVAFFSGDDQSLSSVLQLGAGGSTTKGRTATAPLDGRKTAAFELVAATSKAKVSTADLGGDLFKITAADDSGMVPSATVSKERVQLQLTPDGKGTSGDVAIVLSSKVRWSLRFTGAGDEQVVDLSAGQVAGIDVIGGSRRFELSLPKATGTVPVHVTGAIEDFSIQSPPGSPVRVQMQGGAKTVAAGKVTLRDVKPGSTLTPKDWKVANRYDVDASARLTLLSVDIAG